MDDIFSIVGMAILISVIAVGIIAVSNIVNEIDTQDKTITTEKFEIVSVNLQTQVEADKAFINSQRRENPLL